MVEWPFNHSCCALDVFDIAGYDDDVYGLIKLEGWKGGWVIATGTGWGVGL